MAIEVWTIQDLININNNLSEDYIQMADIDISDYEDWQGIGTFFEPFIGSYNGNGFEIIGYPNINRYECPALFGYTENATIENVIVEKMPLIYYIIGSTNVKNCHVRNISFEGVQSQFGGLVCYVSEGALIENCFVDNVSVRNCKRATGGFIGYGQGVECYNCTVKNFTAIDSEENTGGFISSGYGTSELISIFKNCSANVNIKSNNNIGGFVNTFTGFIAEECFASGTLEGSGNIGGFSASVPEGNFKDCYFKGDIICTGSGKQIGGFSSFAPATSFRNCYSAANISAQNAANVFGFSYPPGDILNCYYNSDMTGITAGAGEPRTTEQMTYPYDENTYEGWDFDDIWGPDTLHKNEGYPFLRAEIVIEPPIAFKEPTIETYRVNCANPDIIIRAYPPEQGEGAAHFKLEVYNEIGILLDSIDTLSNPEKFKYSKNKVTWSNFPEGGLIIQDDIYIKATIYIGPRKNIWLKAGIGEGE